VSEVTIRVTVNGEERRATVEPRLLLVHFLREVLELTGTHIGCDTTSCGACTVVLDGRAVKSCTMFAVQADGSEITTIEGLAHEGRLHPLQDAFHVEYGLQCGFCTPGMIMAALPFVEERADPSDDEIRRAISGNLCRCTGYVNIVSAVRRAARTLHGLDVDPAPADASGGTGTGPGA
jgi:carbon-monoxide dehydrogenase small subunit